MEKDINLDFVNEDDVDALQLFYNLIKRIDPNVKVVHDDSLKETLENVFNKNSIFDFRYKIRFVNVFRFNQTDKDFYLIQVEIDKGHKFSPKYGQRDLGFEYQIWGYAQSKCSFGKTYARPLTKIDKFIDRFILVRVRFSQSPSFTSKYYLNTDNKINVQKEFNAAFLNAFAKARDLMLVTNKEDFIIGFNRSISFDNSRAIFKILKAAEFLRLAKLESA